MAAPGIPLTVAGGGMTRLRVKGAALKNSLYQLTNGYVTAAQTVKVRPGTFRTANIADASDAAGITKGLVAFQNALHVFCHQQCTVPDGYVLHVLNHPAAFKPTGANPTVFTMVANHSGLAPTNIGYSASAPFGSLSPTTFTGLDGRTYTVAEMINQGTNSNGFLLQLDWTGTAPTQEGVFANISFTDQNSNAQSFDSSAATFQVIGSLAQWEWPQSHGSMFGNTDTYTITMGSPEFEIIPLKEIHFAAPFMGFLYVVAEFDVDSATLAAWGSTYHYWLRNVGVWQPDTVYQIGDIVQPSVANGFTFRAARISSPNPAWTPQTLHSVDDIVEPTVANGYFFTAIETDGANPITGTTEPTWPTTEGATVVEDSETANNDVVAAAPASQTQPPPATGTKYVNPYSSGSNTL